MSNGAEAITAFDRDPADVSTGNLKLTLQVVLKGQRASVKLSKSLF